MTIQTVRAPYAQPMSVLEARKHLRLSTNAQDSLIASCVVAVREMAEHQTQRQLVAARLRLLLDHFPRVSHPLGYANVMAYPGDAGGYHRQLYITIPRAPVLRVVSIEYMDTAGVVQTLDPATYVVSPVSLDTPATIYPLDGAWPRTRCQPGAVLITFDAGHAAPITADATANTITVKGWPDLAQDDVLRFTNSGGSLPTPLVADTDYFVKAVMSPGTYTLAATAGGTLIDITDPGTGQSYLGEVPESIKSWMKLRLGALDVNREEVGPKLELMPLPFVDRLLDSHKIYT